MTYVALIRRWVVEFACPNHGLFSKWRLEYQPVVALALAEAGIADTGEC